RRFASAPVQLVDQLVHRMVLALGLGIEDVADADDDLTHMCPGGDETRIVRYRGCAFLRQDDRVLSAQRHARAEHGGDDDSASGKSAQRRHLYCSAMNGG